MEMPDPAEWSVDHVFVVSRPGAPSVERLVEAGFTEGPSNVHPGQGTACRRFFFSGPYLEVLWRDEGVEADVAGLDRTTIPARASMRDGACRFGIGVRGHPPDTPPPIRTKAYRPRYLPEGVAIPIAANAAVLAEPMIFFLPGGGESPPTRPPHGNGASEVTSVAITIPTPPPWSDELEWARGLGGLTVEHGGRQQMTIRLDHGRRGARVSLEPAIPLALEW